MIKYDETEPTNIRMKENIDKNNEDEDKGEENRGAKGEGG